MSRQPNPRNSIEAVGQPIQRAVGVVDGEPNRVRPLLHRRLLAGLPGAIALRQVPRGTPVASFHRIPFPPNGG
jgi:hypothetical protein